MGVVLIVGCGGGGAPLDEVVGEWQSPINGFNCVRVLNLQQDATFGLGLACVLNNNAVAMETHTGAYAADGKDLVLTQSRSSCPGDVREAVSFSYHRAGDNLTLIDDGGAIVFATLPPGPSGGGAVQAGCFDASLSFTAAPVHDVF